MLALLSVSATAMLAAPTAPTPPVWPTKWVAVEAGTEQVGPQTIRNTLTSFFDGDKNRTCQTNITHTQYDTVITDYNAGGDGKQYFIRTYGTLKDKTLVRHCQFWCAPTGGPIACNTGDSLCSYNYKHKARYLGPNTINGKPVDTFFWGENLGPIPMNSLKLYTTQGANPMPVRMFRDIHPFGKELGNSTIDYTSFTPQTGDFDDSIFDLGPDAKYDCSSTQPGADCQSIQAALRLK